MLRKGNGTGMAGNDSVQKRNGDAENPASQRADEFIAPAGGIFANGLRPLFWIGGVLLFVLALTLSNLA